ncbi:AAA family ATPase [Danxiaibacter flavus]|uniref:AAA family ATPase n=1 Tax=Danxiaibacter flavus TaxID=3049108 RepID=A0ABV3ZK37_9BACT|nr:AAA family ATPase [Chitinophagaceae bacterium DXS]
MAKNCIRRSKKKYASLIRNEYVYRWYRRKKKGFEFDKILIVLNNQIILDIDEDYCEILHNGINTNFINDLVTLCNKFKEKQRREPLEINLIVQNRSSFDLKPMEIKRTKLDIDLYYEDDFKDVDDIIRKRLNKKQDKGIVLLHGLPGTGKTTYLRYLIGKIKKKILFLSPSVAGNLMNPEFMDLLIENPNCVIVIEDAENIIMDRKSNNSSSVSNLLNISDGLLSDFLNVQLVCTFNSSITLIDEALMRKGRLIARYEFGKLGVKKAQKLSDHLGFAKRITEPMTIAEITNPNERTYQPKQVEIIGFRRA